MKSATIEAYDRKALNAWTRIYLFGGKSDLFPIVMRDFVDRASFWTVQCLSRIFHFFFTRLTSDQRWMDERFLNAKRVIGVSMSRLMSPYICFIIDFDEKYNK